MESPVMQPDPPRAADRRRGAAVTSPVALRPTATTAAAATTTSVSRPVDTSTAAAGQASTAAHPPALLALRRVVLETLRGPDYRPVHAVPRRWPVLRAHVAGVVTMLWQEGLLERSVDPHSGGALPIYRATEAGIRRLADPSGEV